MNENQNIIVTTDKSSIDVKAVHAFLTRSYWAEGIPIEIVKRSIEGSMCFSILDGHKQVGFARVITDKATFAYLADVYVLEEYRGQGLSRQLMEMIMSHPDLQGLRRFLLATRDAHGLYAQYGFTPITDPKPWMQVHQPDVYR